MSVISSWDVKQAERLATELGPLPPGITMETSLYQWAAIVCVLREAGYSIMDDGGPRV